VVRAVPPSPGGLPGALGFAFSRGRLAPARGGQTPQSSTVECASGLVEGDAGPDDSGGVGIRELLPPQLPAPVDDGTPYAHLNGPHPALKVPNVEIP